MSIILGIDPGSRVTGYGVIRQNGRHLEYLGSGAIRTQVEDLPYTLKTNLCWRDRNHPTISAQYVCH